MKKPKVLVVDDEPETVKYVSANLRARGYDVLTAEDGRTARAVFSGSVVDLVILAIMRPGPDGVEVCQTIRRQSDVPVILLSARGRESDGGSALGLGAAAYPPAVRRRFLERVPRAAFGAASQPFGRLETAPVAFVNRQVSRHSRFSKRVCSLIKTKSTFPTAPFLCLPTISSAFPRSAWFSLS